MDRPARSLEAAALLSLGPALPRPILGQKSAGGWEKSWRQLRPARWHIMSSMGTATLVSVSEYLSTDYSPDCDYVDGEVLERNVGEKDHGRLQALLIGLLLRLEKRLGIWVVLEQRVQVSPTRYRVPDICVIAGPEPQEQIFTQPPFLCVEILSPEDRMSRMQEKIDDYLRFGVRFVWLVNPETKRAYVYTSEGMVEVKDGVLRTKDPGIAVPLAEVFPA